MLDMGHCLAALTIHRHYQSLFDLRNIFMAGYYTSLPQGWARLVVMASNAFKYTPGREVTPPFGVYRGNYFIGGYEWEAHFYKENRDFAVLDFGDGDSTAASGPS